MTRFSSWRLAFALLLVGAASLLSIGCSRPVGSVTGKVTFQGKPLKGGNVAFVSSEGRQSFASGIKEDGTYEVPNIQGGSYKVTVETASLKPPATAAGTGMGGIGQKAPVTKEGTGAPPPGQQLPDGYKASSPASGQAAANAKKYVAIPDKYADADKSELTYTFNGGSDTFNIDLK